MKAVRRWAGDPSGPGACDLFMTMGARVAAVYHPFRVIPRPAGPGGSNLTPTG